MLVVSHRDAVLEAADRVVDGGGLLVSCPVIDDIAPRGAGPPHPALALLPAALGGSPSGR